MEHPPVDAGDLELQGLPGEKVKGALQLHPHNIVVRAEREDLHGVRVVAPVYSRVCVCVCVRVCAGWVGGEQGCVCVVRVCLRVCVRVCECTRTFALGGRVGWEGGGGGDCV